MARSSNRKAKQSGRSMPQELADAPAFDRRAIEGMMRELVTGMTGESSQVDAAQQIMYEAFEATSPHRQISLARQALEISPECADAYVLLAEYAPTLAKQLELYEQGVAAGEQALGPERFQEDEGHFWGLLETRPYMRARAGLADCLWRAGRRDEAVDHFRDMLRLNPNDNQGIRYRLATMLLDLARHDELERLLRQYEEDGSAEWACARALVAFRREGDSANARRRLTDANEVNSHVGAYLAGARLMPRELPQYVTPGGEDEAVGCAAQFLPAWRDTPGAAAWLRKTLKLSAAVESENASETWGTVRRALAQLPLCEDEAWEVDLRSIAAVGDGESPALWGLLVWSTKEQRPFCLEFFDDRPSDREVWNILIDVMRDPEEGDAYRPAALCVARKAWFRSWKSKLQQVGVEFRLKDSLDQIDRWLIDAAPQLESAQRMAGHGASADEQWSQTDALPQRAGEVWQACVQRLPAWVQVAGEPTRPWVSLVADAASQAILATELATETPAADWLFHGVSQAMHHPAVGEPHRPGVIQVASHLEREMLAAHLEPAGVRCVAGANLEPVRRLIDNLADHLACKQRVTALVDSPGVTSRQVGDFFAAAAAYYRLRPWRNIPGDSVFQVDCDRLNSGPWYAVVMGQSGIELGLALYEDLEALRGLLSGEISVEASRRRTSALSLTYGEAFEIAPQDLDAAEEQGWPVAGPEAYPIVLRVKPGLAIAAPLKWEVELLEGCLRAIPEFLAERTSDAQIPVTVAGDAAMIRLKRVEGDE